MAIMTQVVFLLVSCGVRGQVNHHIYSFTDLMATDSVSHSFTVAVPPPPGFLPSYSPLYDEAGQNIGEAGSRLHNTAAEAVHDTAVAGLRQASGDIRDTAPLQSASSQTSRIFLPTPLPTTLHQDPKQKLKSG